MRPRLRHRDSSSSHKRILPMVVAAKTYSSFSRRDRLERAFFWGDGLQTTTRVFPGWSEGPNLRACRAVRRGNRRRTGLSHNSDAAFWPTIAPRVPALRAGLACQEMAD